MNTDPAIFKRKMLQILKLFDAFCTEYHLRYTLDSGTLIGAVRHRGFIPWDDDIDVAMPREDYMKFLKLTRKRFIDGYKVLSPYNTKQYYLGFAKIIDLNSTLVEFDRNDFCILGVYIDIFPIDFVSKEELITGKVFAKFQKIKRNCQVLLFSKGGPLKTRLLRLIYKICSFNKGYFFLADKYLSLQNERYNNIGWYAWSFFRPKLVFNSNLFDTFIEIPFEGMKFISIKNYDEYLKVMFGDYMTPPPIQERRSNHSHHYMNLTKRYTRKELILMGILK